jgi:3-oxoacyl-[acyl-carrier-protein] synthase-3
MSSRTARIKQRPAEGRRSRLGRLLGTQILAVGGSVPDQVVDNADLAALGFDADWILQRTGISQRRHVPPGMATSDLAVEAARRCIDRANVDPDEIDLVLVATCTPDMPMPATACLVQDRLGLRALAFDLQAACAGFVFGLLTGMQYVASGCSRRALVIGADCHSRVVDPSDEQIYPLFGDGAGAVLVAPGSPEQGMLSYAVGSDGAGAGVLCRRVGGSQALVARSDGAATHPYMTMEGRAVFKWAVHVLGETIRDVLRAAGVGIDDVHLVVLHQANIRIINAAVDDLGIDREMVLNNLDRLGNTGAASIPLVLDEAQQQGRLNRGELVLVSGFGGGLAWGTALMRW